MVFISEVRLARGHAGECCSIPVVFFISLSESRAFKQVEPSFIVSWCQFSKLVENFLDGVESNSACGRGERRIVIVVTRFGGIVSGLS